MDEEIVFTHIYNPDAWAVIPGAIRAAERLGYRCEVKVTRDAQDCIHSIIVTAGIRHAQLEKLKKLSSL